MRPLIKKCSGLVFATSTFALEMFPVREGHGDCEACVYDSEENKKCLGYRPINVYDVEVKDNLEGGRK